MRIIFFTLLCFYFSDLQSQLIKVTTYDTIDWENLPQEYQNATLHVLDGKNGNIVEIKNYKKNKKHGLFLSSFTMYGLKVTYLEKNYKNGILHGYYENHESNGFYKNGKKSNLWNYYRSSGKDEKIFYVNGKKEGKYYSYYEDAEIKGFYKNDLKNGEWITTINNIATLKKIYKKGNLVKEVDLLEVNIVLE